ncbi:MAG: nickel pincer cofactor biosynthesis protein LarB [Lentisphaeraceae bacterium]|nr:nickel pincer cofactor biosynthesis protein LarB [Lentisphaeraceae bacterium]
MNLDQILNALKDGVKSIEEAKQVILNAQTAEMEDIVVDLHREERCGLPEVVYGRVKTVEQIKDAAKVILEESGRLLITRIDKEKAGALLPELPGCVYCERSKTVCKLPETSLKGKVLVLGAGTSDSAVVEEAAVTCRMFGAETKVIIDVGVAGLNRLLEKSEDLRNADCIIICAGMEGALPSVVGGLVKVPVIAVPVSSGYGTSFGGVSALLGMLNSCASGLTVVNVDNGFGAGYAAGRILLAAESIASK